MYHPPSSSSPGVITSPTRPKRRPSDAVPGDDKPGKKRRGSQYGQGHAPDHANSGGGANEDMLGGAIDNPGAKHWSDEEKTKFFIWLLGSDEHWEQFGTKMNTCFREVREMTTQSFSPCAPTMDEMGSLRLHHLSSITSKMDVDGACRHSPSVIRYDHQSTQFPPVLDLSKCRKF